MGGAAPRCVQAPRAAAGASYANAFPCPLIHACSSSPATNAAQSPARPLALRSAPLHGRLADAPRGYFVRSFADLIAQHGWCHCAAEIPRNAMGKVNKKELVQLFV